MATGISSDVKGKPRVLVVDDTRTDRLKLKILLSDDYTVLLAADGQEGLEAAKIEAPELILLDMFLPDMDGFCLLKKLREQDSTSTIPVIMLSAYFEEVDHIVEALEFGANDYLIKPVNEKILSVKASQIIRMHRAESALRDALNQREQLLQTMQSAIIGVDCNDRVHYWNDTAEICFARSREEVLYQPILSVGIAWEWDILVSHILLCLDNKTHSERFEMSFQSDKLGQRLLSVGIAAFLAKDGAHNGYIILADDVTERVAATQQLQQAEKLQSIGQLASGIAHEINTPMQYIGDNTRFLQEAFSDLNEIVEKSKEMSEVIDGSGDIHVWHKAFEALVEKNDFDYLSEEVPKAIEQALEGIGRVSTIVKAMQDFSHPGAEGKELIDINRAISSTVTVARNVWKYVADLDLELDSKLPEVPCMIGPFNEVILNLIVNASHAIADISAEGVLEKGRITIATEDCQGYVEIRVSDTGGGIPVAIQKKIFDPFFTTKEVGKGTGQGLALSYDIIIKKHDGELFFDTQEGKGTTFFIHLPYE